MLMADCLINLLELFLCHCLRSSSCCKMADWCVCSFTDMPLRLRLHLHIRTTLSTKHIHLWQPCLLYAHADLMMHNMHSPARLHVGSLRSDWSHRSIRATRRRHHISLPSFTVIQLDFFAPLADLFVCVLTEMPCSDRTVSLGVCVCFVMDRVVTVHFFFSFSLRQMSVIFPAWSSSANTRGEVQQHFWPHCTYARSHFWIYTHVAHLSKAGLTMGDF